MWFGRAWPIKPRGLFKVVSITALFTYLAESVKGWDLPQKRSK